MARVLGLFCVASSIGGYRGLGDKYLVRMDELVSPLDRHVLHVERPPPHKPWFTKLIRRRISRQRREADHGRNEFTNNPYKLPAVDQCGSPRIAPSTYIRNGTCSPYGAFPWTVQIQIRNSGSYQHQCGGSLLSDTHVLTAGHCFSGAANPRLMRVVVGQYNFDKIDPEEMAFEIESVTVHPSYQEEGPFSHDLALVKIRRKAGGAGVRISDSVAPVCLPGQGTRIQDGTSCVISGWGKLLHDAELSPECLRSASVPTMSQARCRGLYANSSQGILASMLCAGYRNGGVDACKGDSGGPLACYIDGKYQLIGVISWGFGCGKAENPGVYSRVTHYSKWIQQQMER